MDEQPAIVVEHEQIDAAVRETLPAHLSSPHHADGLAGIVDDIDPFIAR
jgi:hypothetical protein